jgi:hypothetical protein
MKVLGLNDGNLDITSSTNIKIVHKRVRSNYTYCNAKGVQTWMSSSKSFQASSSTSNETNT